MATTFAVRQAGASDWGEVRRILTACNLPIAGVQRQLENTYAVAESGEGLIGVAGVEICGNFGLLRSVAVASDWRGRGVGRALVNDRLAWAQCIGLTQVFLLTIDAAAYFRRLGFTVSDRDTAPGEIKASVEFDSLCPASAVLMARLPNPPV